MKRIIAFARTNVVMLIAASLALITAFIVPPDKEYIEYFDFKTLTCLFTVLAVVCALRNVRFFYTLAEKNWPLIGLEAMGMNLEDIFIAIVDQSAPKTRYERKSARTKTARAGANEEFAKKIVDNADKRRGGQYSALFDDEE